MGIKHLLQQKDNYKLILPLVSLLTFVILFSLRFLDDNRLTSWQWVFADLNPLVIYFFLVAVFVISFLFLKVSVPVGFNGIFLFFISYAISGIFWNEPEVIIDTARYFTQAKYLELYGVNFFLREWGYSINAWTDLPLVPFFYGVIFKYFGEARLYIQIFTTALFSMTIVVTYLTGRELWDENTGFYGGLLLLGMPYLFTQVPLMLVDVPAMFFLMLSVFTFIMALRKGGAWLFISSFSIFLAFLSKYSAWLMLSVLIFIFLAGLLRNSEIQPRVSVTRTLLVMLGAGALTGIVFWYKSDIFWGQIKLLIDYQKPGLSRWGESFISTFFFQIHPFISIAALYSVYAALKRKDLKYLIIVWLVALVLVMQIRRIRYIIMVFPMIALMASYGLREVQNRDVRKFIVSCALIASVALAVFAYLPFMKKLSAVNLKTAGEFLNTVEGTEIKVIALQSENPAGDISVAVPVLDLFTLKKITLYNKEGSEELTEKNKASPLRFTWEYKIPEYYITETDPSAEKAVVIISDSAETELPGEIRHQIKDYDLFRQFKTNEDLFLFKTMVRVYLKTKSVQ